MQTRNKIAAYLYISLCVGLGLLSSCKKDDMAEPVRLFRPVIKEDLLSEGNWIQASWQKVKGAVSYTLEISRDTFRTIDVSRKVDTNVVLLDNLRWNQLYQVQVRAIAADTVFSSKMSLLGNIKTARFPTILATPDGGDVTDEAVRVEWTQAGDVVTRLKILLLKDSSLVKEVALTPGDVVNQYKIVTGLKPGTGYIIYLYSGTTVRGWDNYITKATLTGIVIDLRSITDRTSVLSDTLPQIPAGSTVLLKRGFLYTMGTALNLSKTVTIMSGDDLGTSDQAKVFMSASNLNIAAGSNIDSIAFKNVFIYSDGYAGKYVFNISNACTIGKIIFEGCRARVFRGMARLQTAVINVSDFVVKDCVIDSISNYGVVNVDNVNCKINNIAITNSTIYKTEKVVTSKQNGNSVTIENCTFNEAPWGGDANYLIDWGSLSLTSGIRIANCIMGIGFNKSGSVLVRGIRIGTGSIDVSNTYSTSDYTATSNLIPNLMPYGKPSTDLFTDPANGNFKIKDNGFPGRNSTGDPQWRP